MALFELLHMKLLTLTAPFAEDVELVNPTQKYERAMLKEGTTVLQRVHKIYGLITVMFSL